MKKLLLTGVALVSFNSLWAQPFVSVAGENGLTMGYGFGAFGGGLSFCDFNQDGWDDLTFTSQAGFGLYFFVNEGGSFTQIPAPVNNTSETKQVLWVDYDNDGDKDLFVTAYDAPNRLYRNDGDLQMTDVTFASGIGLANHKTFGATFGDYDRDGWLDLYVVNRDVEPVHNYLYRNMGDGTFTEVSFSGGVQNGFKPSFCASFFDIDKDLWPDLYIAQDRYNFTNDLYGNTGTGIFVDIGEASGTNIAIDAMNVGVGDYDEDGDLDFYVTNTEEGNVLFRNDGEIFTEVAGSCGVVLNEVSWGGNFFDYDLDGLLDLYVSANNADVSNVLYRNLNAGQFSSPILFGGDLGQSFANAIGDIDRDGRPDIAVCNAMMTPFRLWHNVQETDNNWIAISLEGTVSNRDGVGSWIEVFAGERVLTRYTHCGTAYLAQNSSRMLVGIGGAEVIDSIRITWLSGAISLLENVEINQDIKIVEEDIINELAEELAGGENGVIEKAWPVGKRLNIQLSGKVNGPGELVLYDIAGRLFRRQVTYPDQLTRLIQIDVANLPSGVYFITYYGEKGLGGYKVIIP